MQNPRFLLICRSLTYAQRSVRILERAGVTGTLSRVPKSAEVRGCGYCVVVSGNHLKRAVSVLSESGLRPERVLTQDPDGSYSEVTYDLP